MAVPAVDADDRLVLLGTENAVVGAGDGISIWLLDREELPWEVLDPTDFFIGNCALAVVGELDDLDFPLNSYETSFGYCAVAIRVSVDPGNKNRLLGSIQVISQVAAIRMVLWSCGHIVPASSIVAVFEDAPEGSCAVAGFVSPGGYGYLLVDTGLTGVPVSIQVTVTSVDGLERTGWINLLPAGN